MKTFFKSIGLLIILFFPLVVLLTSAESKIDINSDIQVKKMSELQIPFIENQGQVKDKSIRFYADTLAGKFLITDRGEMIHHLIQSRGRSHDSEARDIVSIRESLVRPEQLDINSHDSGIEPPPTMRRLKSCIFTVKGTNRSETRVNYFIGHISQSKTNLNTWQEVSLGEIYQGIELILKAHRNTVEKIFTVHPHGSVADIMVKIEGIKGFYINEAGELELETAIGPVIFTKPIAYQEIKGQRVEVAVKYVLPTNYTLSAPSNLAHDVEGLSPDDTNQKSALVYAFSVDEYDVSEPLIIDPTLGYSTYFKLVDSRDSIYDCTVDQDGAVYVTGLTWSPDFIITKGSFQTTIAGERDVFITKIKPDGTGLVYSTYLGGRGTGQLGDRGTDVGYGIAVDSAGNAYVTGYTESSDFPTLKAIQPKKSGSYDAFIAKIDPNGSALVYSTFLGGSGADYGDGLAIDTAGHVYVMGSTSSTNFPTKNPIQPAKAGSSYTDVFVTKIDTTGSSLVYSTYLGGTSIDQPFSIAVDIYGQVYLTGKTTSTDFPMHNAFQSVIGSPDASYKDAFVTKIKAEGSALVYSTYLGGNRNDEATAIAADSQGNAYVTGITYSTNFPLQNPIKATHPIVALNDAFVTKFNATGSSLIYSTYLGGSNNSSAIGIKVDGSGHAYVAGSTDCTDFPVVNPVQTFYGGQGDAFMAKLNPTGTGFIYSTYLGGNTADYPLCLALDNSGSAYVVGRTSSDNFPTTPGALENSYDPPSDMFVANIIEDLQLKQIRQLKSESLKPPQIEFEKGLPVFISMRVPVPADLPDDPVIQALNFLERYKYLYQLNDPKTDFYLKRIKTNQFDEVSGTSSYPLEWHIFFGQHKNGLPVHLASLAVHIIGNKITSTGGRYLAKIPDLPPHLLKGVEAEAKALSEVQGTEVKVVGVTKLFYYCAGLREIGGGTPDPTDSQTHLAWRVMLRGGRLLDDLGTSWEYFIDAHNGNVLHSLELSIEHNNPPKDFEIYTAHHTGSSWCWNWPDDGSLEKWFTHSGPTDGYNGGDTDGDNAFAFAHTIYDYFHETFGRHSYDADGEQVEDIIHVREDWRQAMYDIGCDHFIFGDYLPVLDIMAHEFTHGITSSEADLYYENHSGALNESYSDVFAELAEYWATGSANWLIGEDVGYREEDATAGGFDDRGVGDDVREKGSQCENGLDDDADGFIDEGCPETGTHCGDAVDNDADGFIDEGCPETNNECGNLVDNDGDGYRDEGCLGSCQDGLENGEDDAFDSADTNCFGRDMADPTRKGDPDHNNDYVNTNDDHGGVHTNSGIPNKVAYLIANGGVHYGINVRGIGLEKTQWLYYKVLTDRLDTNSGFRIARRETLEQAQLFVDDAFRVLIDGLYENFTQEDVCSVRNAFASVGLANADSDCDSIIDDEDTDIDGDYIEDPNDNCLGLFNPDQDDTDGDTIGDRCDPDIDGDGMDNEVDPCRYIANADDFDCDGVLDATDNCPATENTDQLNDDGDWLGNACDTDRDGDNVANEFDNCPSIYNWPQINSDGDNFGNACDNCDYFSNDRQEDMDRDGIGDVCDDDQDGDGEPNDEDSCPDLANLWKDRNANGIDLACDRDEQFMLSGDFGDFFHGEIMFPKLGESIQIPIFPCLQDGCEDWLAANYRTEVFLSLPFDMQARIVDDRGFVISKAKAGLVKTMGFHPGADYFYRMPADVQLSSTSSMSSLPSSPFLPSLHATSEQTIPRPIYQGRSYFLEILPNNQVRAGQVYPFTIRVQSRLTDHLDLDGDCFSVPMDCDDSNSLINPEAVEVCDSLDNNCDGLTDEEGAQECRDYYLDVDHDRHGVEGDSKCLCSPDASTNYMALYAGDPDDGDSKALAAILTGHLYLPKGWSLISLPLEPEKAIISTLFPEAQAIFKFTSKYELLNDSDSLVKGQGYWIYLPEAYTYTITGTPIINHTSLPYPSGWSLIGGCSYPAELSVPSGKIRAIYTYQDNKYEHIDLGDLLEPAKGYWINLSE